MKTAKIASHIGALLAALSLSASTAWADTGKSPSAAQIKTQQVKPPASRLANDKDEPIVREKIAEADGPLFVAPPNIHVHEPVTTSQHQIQAYREALQKTFGTVHVSPRYTQPTNADGAFGVPSTPFQYQSLMNGYSPNTGALAGHNCNKGDTDRLTCMVCNIYFEAANQSDAGQVEVGRTVMARLFSTAYAKSPNTTTCKIIYDPEQYSWTSEKKDHHLPASGETLDRIVANAKKALQEGPGAFTNYFAIDGMANHQAPEWARSGTNCGDNLVAIGAHQFCAIGNFKNRSESEVLTAESYARGAPVYRMAEDANATQ